jgi:hypothetical protein
MMTRCSMLQYASVLLQYDDMLPGCAVLYAVLYSTILYAVALLYYMLYCCTAAVVCCSKLL